MLGVQATNDTVGILISHDCDIPQEKEGYLELILGLRVPKPDKNCLSAKNVRKLHLPFTGPAGQFYVELCFQNRIIVVRDEFCKLSGPLESVSLADADKRTLKQWLTVRYGRPAYPNTFENRLKRECRKKTPVEKGIGELAAKKSAHITALFFSLGEEREVELGEGEPYYLSIYVVYDSENGAMEARKEAEALAKEILALMRSVYGEPEDASEICVESCTALADTQLSLATLMKIDQWRLEWVSLNDEDPGFLALGG